MLELIYNLTVSASIWGSGLPGIEIPIIGSMYPYRILVFFLLVGTIFFKKNHKLSLKFEYPTLLLFLFIISYGVLSVLFSPVQEESLKKTINYVISIIFLILLLINIDNKVKLEKTLKIISINYIMLILIGLFESLTGKHGLYAEGVFIHLKTQLGLFYPIGPTKNPNDFALLLMTLLPFVYYYFNSAKNNKKASILLMIASIFLILNCEAKIVLLSFGLYIILNILRMRNLKMKFNAVFYIGLLLLFLIIVLNNVGLLQIIMDDFSSLSLEKGSGGVRFDLFKNGLKLLVKSGFLGVGIGVLPHYLNSMPELLYIQGGLPHNSWLEFMVEFGIINFILLFIWFICIYKKINRAKNKEICHNQEKILNISLNSMIIFPISVLASSSVTSDPFIWLFFGLIASIANLYDPNKVEINNLV